MVRPSHTVALGSYHFGSGLAPKPGSETPWDGVYTPTFLDFCFRQTVCRRQARGVPMGRRGLLLYKPIITDDQWRISAEMRYILTTNWLNVLEVPKGTTYSKCIRDPGIQSHHIPSLS